MSAAEGSQKVKMHIDPTERAWIRAAIVILVIFAISVTIAGFMLGIQVPTEEQRVDPQTITNELPWSEPGVREIIPDKKYDVYIISRMWFFEPSTIPAPDSGIEIPKGAEITFYVTSIDVQHGFKLQDTNVNFMAVPGEVSKLSTTFDRAGSYDFICTEFCGTGHASMYGTLTVTE